MPPDRRPKTCLRDETYVQRHKSRPYDREKPAENRPFRRQVFHGEFRSTVRTRARTWALNVASNLFASKHFMRATFRPSLKMTVMCVKFSKIDLGVRLSHPLGAAVARSPQSAALASDGGTAAHA